MTNDMPGSDRPPMVIRAPSDLVAAVPYLLGFHPRDSLVVIGTGGAHGLCAMRIDLPPAGSGTRARAGGGAAKDIAGRFAGMLKRNGFPHALLVGYGPARRVTPLIDAARPALAAAGVELCEALRVTGDRFWSYDCRDPGCCPAEGTPFDVTSSVVAAQATLEGRVALADRDELTRSVAPLGGIARRGMRVATDRAEERLLRWVRAGPDAVTVRARMAAAGVPLVREILGRAGLRDGRPPDIPGRAGGTEARPTDDEVAWLGVLLTHVRVRDEAWVRIGLDRIDRHIAFWRDILRRVEEPYAAAPACLMAYAAYSAGEGGLANVALERAFGTDPEYSVAHLLHGLISAGAPPSAVRPPMTPADLAVAYGEGDETESDPGIERRAS